MASIDYKNHKTAVICKFKMVIILCKSIVAHKVGHASLLVFLGGLILKSAKIMAALSSFRELELFINAFLNPRFTEQFTNLSYTRYYSKICVTGYAIAIKGYIYESMSLSVGLY